MKKCFLFFLIFFAVFSCFSADGLLILKEDIRLVYEEGQGFDNVSGFHIYIRKKDGMESVMLTETTKDPDGKSANYAYRAMEYNPINGDEIRYLDGKPLVSEYSKYSLIDSTVEDDAVFGKAFHIYVPSEIQFGYPWARNGKIKIDKGTFINVRSFEKKYGDYTGQFADNPFMFNLGTPVKKELPPPVVAAPVEEPVVVELTDDYNQKAVESFEEIAGFNGGKMIYSKGPDSIIDDINEAIDRIDEKKADIVFAIDATGSMKDDIEQLRREWILQLIEKLKKFDDCRIGLLLYRDYGDNFRYKNLPVKFFDFTKNIDQFTHDLNNFKIYGMEGGDIPEAVYEALYASMKFYGWRSGVYKKVILIGDAEPHPSPRGMVVKVSKDTIVDLANKTNTVIDTIILPDNKSERGR